MTNLERIVKIVEAAIADLIVKRDKKLDKAQAKPEKSERYKKSAEQINGRINEMNSLLADFITAHKGSDDEIVGYAEINDYGAHGRTDDGTIIYELKKSIRLAK